MKKTKRKETDQRTYNRNRSLLFDSQVTDVSVLFQSDFTIVFPLKMKVFETSDMNLILDCGIGDIYYARRNL